MTVRTLTVSVSMLAVMLLATTVSAQTCIKLAPGETYVPGSLRDQYGNPVYNARICPPRIKTPDFDNPVIHHVRHSGVAVNPNSGNVVLYDGQHTIKGSALDPNRHIVDPGSLQYVDKYYTDNLGRRWHVTGKRWNSYGTPHSTLNRIRISQAAPGIGVQQQQLVETQSVERGSPMRSRPRPAPRASNPFPEFD